MTMQFSTMAPNVVPIGLLQELIDKTRDEEQPWALSGAGCSLAKGCSQKDGLQEKHIVNLAK